MPRYVFNAKLVPEQVLAYYKQHVSSVIVVTDQGLKIQLEIRHFQPFFTHHGLDGRFVLDTDPSGRFIRLEKII